MSRHVSGVTLSKMESRRENVVSTATDTLVRLDDISAHLRCAEAVHTKQQRSVWAGDREGGIVVRDFATSRPLTVIERKQHNVFVNCIRVAGEGRVWAGLCDGSLRIFDAVSYRLVDDFRAHGSAITAMAVARMPSACPDREHHMQVVLTASADWSIAKWDAATGQCLGRLMGHNNTVRCLAPSASGEYLVSGGDDGTARLWSLCANQEVTYENTPPPCAWPMSCHSGKPVVGIAVVRDQYVVSVGQDGSAQACQMSLAGAWLAEVDARPCALTSVSHDAPNRRIWVGGVDGIIAIVDDSAPDFARLATVHDHSGAYVSAICPLGLCISHMVWALSPDGVLSRFTESTSRFHGMHPLIAAREDESSSVCESVSKGIEQLRDSVVRNYNELQRLRKELNYTEEIDTRTCAHISQLQSNTSLKRRYVALALHWLHKERTRRRMRALVDATAALAARRLQEAYWLRWFAYTRAKKRRHAKQVFTEVMMRTEDALRVQRYCTMLMQAAIRERVRRSLLNCLQQHSASMSAIIRSRYFTMWMNLRADRRERQQRNILLQSILRGPHETMIRRYWNALVASRLRQAHNATKVSMALAGFRETCRATMADLFRKWLIFTRQRLIERERAAAHVRYAAISLAHPSHQRTALKYFCRWLAHIRNAHRRRVESELAAADRELRSWEEAVRNSSHLTPEAIARDAQQADADLAESQAELKELQRELRNRVRATYDLKRQIAMVGFADRLLPEASLPERVESVMLYFRAKGVAAVSDYATVMSARETFDKIMRDRAAPASTSLFNRTKRPKAPPHPFERALHHLKAKIFAAVRAVGHTPVNTEDPADWGLLDEWLVNLRRTDAAAVVEHLKLLVVTYDACTSARLPIPSAALTELLDNSYLLIPMVTTEAQKSALEYVKEEREQAELAPAPQPLAPQPQSRPGSPSRSSSPVSPRRPAGKSPAPPVRSRTPTANARAPSPTPRKGVKAAAARPRTAAPPTPRASAPVPTSAGPKPFLGLKLQVNRQTVAGRVATSLSIGECTPDGPAGQAGVVEGDTLLRFCGVAVTDAKGFNAVAARSAKVGAVVVVTVLRGGEALDCPITVGERSN